MVFFSKNFFDFARQNILTFRETCGLLIAVSVFSKTKLGAVARRQQLARKGGTMVEIGPKIKSLRVRLGLTQEDLADRCELSKGFISQLERDLTSPSIATLIDILECLGTSLRDFFADDANRKIVFAKADMFEKDDEEHGHITWLVPNAQKNQMEPILIVLSPGQSTWPEDPHEGEEFGYVLSGSVTLHHGARKQRVKSGESFCFTPSSGHYLSCAGSREARVLWIATPPSF